MMTVKQVHCIPSCMTPKTPAKHSNPDMYLQHAMSALVVGSTTTFAKAAVADVVPSSTKYGEIPSLERLAMILICCGR